MPLARFEPALTASERRRTYDLDRGATGRKKKAFLGLLDP
jgi:hypothetical protein